MSHLKELGLKCLFKLWDYSNFNQSIGIVDCRQLVWYKCSDIKKFKVSNIPLLIIRIKPPHSITSLLPARAVSHPSPDVTHETHFWPPCVSCVWLGVWIALILRGMIPALYLLYTQYICVITAITRGGWRLASQCYSPLIIVTLTHRWLDVTWLGAGAGVTG